MFAAHPLEIRQPVAVSAFILHMSGEDGGFVTVHDVISDERGEACLGAGRVGERHDIANALNWMLTQRDMDISFLPKEVLSISNSHCVWIRHSAPPFC